MNKLLIIGLMLLASCSTIESMYTDVPKGVALAQTTLAAAEHTALIYASLPACGKTTSILCRNPSVTKQIGAADEAAYSAVQAAYQAETQDALNAAITALKALTNITDHLPSGDK